MFFVMLPKSALIVKLGNSALPKATSSCYAGYWFLSLLGVVNFFLTGWHFCCSVNDSKVLYIFSFVSGLVSLCEKIPRSI